MHFPQYRNSPQSGSPTVDNSFDTRGNIILIDVEDASLLCLLWSQHFLPDGCSNEQNCTTFQSFFSEKEQKLGYQSSFFKEKS